ncbi:hypothetical protein GI584_00185 [Gracilibacillus salitolerans]|uniref:Fibronectin type-III domain-containing protein n=1 Tax=Gracilibacillus salitolerans TaxID=2663022 RepID=A0A5Q2TEJ6_9BACI|nr:fibronectin type III domain-containing protein [Gracilibacillus salitolerans]QGH32597.1 hypothetical protein GI584_00185 [Gracilibacillus salitolerans]
MKKIIFMLIVALTLSLIPLSSVFASTYDYHDGLLDDSENIADTNLPGGGYDNDLNTGTGTTYRGTWFIEFVNPVDIIAYYIEGTGGNGAWRFYFHDGTEIVLNDYAKYGYFEFDQVFSGVERIEIEHDGSSYNLIKEVDFFSAPTDDLTPPGEVSNLSINEGYNSLNLSWSNPNDDDFSVVNIYQDDVLIKEGLKDDQSYKVNDLEDNTTYHFKITTVDIFGNESEGKTIEGTTLEIVDSDGDGIPDHEDEYPDDPENIPPPETTDEVPEVENLEIEATPERVDLSWKKPLRYFGKATIYRKTTGTVTSFNMNDLNPFAAQTVYAAEDYEPLFETNGTTFADLSVNENDEYEYKVTNTYEGIESRGVTVQTTIPEPPLVDTSDMTLPFGVEGLIESGNGLLLLIGGFVLLALAFLFVPKVIAAIRQSFSGGNGATQTAAPGTRVTERQQKIMTGQKQREPRAPRIPREPRQGRA